jgi:uncharacterized integral membrane protein
MVLALWILGLLAALAVAVFAGQNPEPVEVRFLAWQTTANLPTVIFVSAALGAVVAGLLGAVSAVRARLRLRRLHAELAQARASASQSPPRDPRAPAPAQAAAPAPAPGPGPSDTPDAAPQADLREPAPPPGGTPAPPDRPTDRSAGV